MAPLYRAARVITSNHITRLCTTTKPPELIPSSGYVITGRLSLNPICEAFCQYQPLLKTISLDNAIEGFGGKRALGFLLKIELCRKRSKFRMQFCLGALNNVLYVFLLKFSSFTRYYICKKKPAFVISSARDHKDGNFT